MLLVCGCFVEKGMQFAFCMMILMVAWFRVQDFDMGGSHCMNGNVEERGLDIYRQCSSESEAEDETTSVGGGGDLASDGLGAPS